MRCNLSLGARIGIAVGSIAVFVALFACLGLTRRRRIRRDNMAYVTAQQSGYTGYGQPYGNQNPYGYGNGPMYDGGGGYAGGGSYPPPQYAAGGYAPVSTRRQISL